MRREELGGLAMFLAVADERSFTRAAARLGISQSALSHSMRRLEARLGLRLLTRTTRSVAPTEAGERLEKDMIAVRISPPLRMAAIGAPSYFAEHGVPASPDDLARHRCINMRWVSAGGLYAWEFEKAGRELNVRVDGQLVFNDSDFIIDAAVAGHGIGFVMADHVSQQLEDGTLARVLEDWCEPFDGYYLYYPSRRQPSPAFSLVLEALRWRE
jgi:DNA-binding transcriptional LysR family regulator